jgi:hypothetical protein
MRPRPRERARVNPRTLVILVVLAVVLVTVARAREHTSTWHGSHLSVVPVHSARLGSTLELGLVSPPGGGGGRPLLVLLPADPTAPGTSITATMLAALAQLGSQAPDLAVPAGPANVYRNASLRGRWERYVLSSAIPAAQARLHADARRVTVAAIGAGAATAAALARSAGRELCRAPAGVSLSLRQAQRRPDTSPLAISPNATTPAVYDYLRSYAVALSRCAPGGP